MTSSEVFSPSDAARRLGISTKALRLYEQRGLIDPVRTAAGWRTYGPAQMERAREIVALRALGLSLSQIAEVLEGDPASLAPALAAHQADLEARVRTLTRAVTAVETLRADLAHGKQPSAEAVADLLQPAGPRVAVDLPWPWDGERFDLGPLAPITFLTGPLGSGKTRLARALADAMPGAAFVALDRSEIGEAGLEARLADDPGLSDRVRQALAWLMDDGASETLALRVLLAALCDDRPSLSVVDMVEDRLDQATQEAVIAFLRHRARKQAPVVLLTRSSAILDLSAVGPDEAIVYCPANHASPMLVAPIAGAPGFEAVATCLAAPAVRARTAGVIAVRQPSV